MLVMDVPAGIFRCRYCGSLTVAMGAPDMIYAQCPKGCPGHFDAVTKVTVPYQGVLDAMRAYKPKPQRKAKRRKRQ